MADNSEDEALAKMEAVAAASAPPTEDLPKAADDGSVTVKLKKPIPVMGDMVSSLKFREATAGDITSVGGSPVIKDWVSEPPILTFDGPKMTAMMARLSGAPTSSIARMGSRDWESCATALIPFFMPNLD